MINILHSAGFRHLALYGVIGCCSSTLDFLIYSLLLRIGLHYLAANGISVLTGITSSFLFNRRYNFKVKDHAKRRFVIFLNVGLCGMVLSNIILYICIDLLAINKLISKLLSIVLVVGFQFIINKYVTFKASK